MASSIANKRSTMKSQANYGKRLLIIRTSLPAQWPRAL